MANNTMQILRSNTTAIPSSLANGQLAYTSNGDILYIGTPATGGAVTPIGGKMYPGILTANLALVANSTSGLNNIITGTLTLQGNTTVSGVISANGVSGTAGYVLFSGGPSSNAYWSSTGSLSTNVNAQYIWSNTQTFQNTITFSSILNVGANVSLNTTSLSIGNSTVNTIVNSTIFLSGNSTVYMTGNSTVDIFVGVNTNTSINASAILIGNATVNATVNSTIYTGTSLLANSAAYLGASLASAYQLNSTLAANVATLASNNSSYLGGVAAANYVTNTGNFTLAGNTTLAGTNTVISSNLTISSTLINAGTANLNIGSLNISGNLNVSRTVETINTSELIVNSNMIELSSGHTTTDLVDSGWFAPGGNTTVTWYSIFGRIAAKSTNNNPYFVMAASNTNPNTASTFDLSAANSSTATLQAYLVPYGVGGAFVANSTAIAFTANSTLSVGLVANSLTLTTALNATSGGTGILGSTYAAGDLVYAATASPTSLTRLSIPGTVANGQVLQITNNLPAYGALDGGSF